MKSATQIRSAFDSFLDGMSQSVDLFGTFRSAYDSIDAPRDVQEAIAADMRSLRSDAERALQTVKNHADRNAGNR